MRPLTLLAAVCRLGRLRRVGVALSLGTVLAGGYPSPRAAATPAVALGYILSDISFVGSRAGYGYFVHPSPRVCRGEVGRTDDGGAVFGHLVEVTSWECSQNAPVNHLATGEHGEGFLYGPDLFVTFDGGRTWAPGAVPGQVLSVAPLGRSVWAVTAVCPKSTSLKCRLELFASDDGGRSWERSEAPAAWTVPFMAAAGQTWTVRTGPRTAYLLSAPTSSPGAHGSYVGIWTTGNGGASWTAKRAFCGIWALSAALSVAS